MDKSKLKQIANKLNKSFSNWDFDKAIKYSKNEAQTRDYLIEEVFQILEYSQMDDYIHEFIADVGKSRGKKVDMAIKLNSNKPQILVECKSATHNLNEKDFRQLNEYCLYVKEAQIGILTNGVIYKFYSRSFENNTILNDTPFFEFDITSYDDSDLHMLSLFYRPTLDLKFILNEADEIYFFQGFEDSLYKLLKEPSWEFNKLIYQEMGGKRMSDKINEKIFGLINSISLQTVVDRIKSDEFKNSKLGVITTAEELKAFNIVKTILGMSSKFNNSQLDRIEFTDYKGKFAVQVDGKQNKGICYFDFDGSNKIIIVGEEKIALESVSVNEITKHKKLIVECALKELS